MKTTDDHQFRTNPGVPLCTHTRRHSAMPVDADALAVVDLLVDSLGRIAEALDFHLDGLQIEEQQAIAEGVTEVLTGVEDLRAAVREANNQAEHQTT